MSGYIFELERFVSDLKSCARRPIAPDAQGDRRAHAFRYRLSQAGIRRAVRAWRAALTTRSFDDMGAVNSFLFAFKPLDTIPIAESELSKFPTPPRKMTRCAVIGRSGDNRLESGLCVFKGTSRKEFERHCKGVERASLPRDYVRRICIEAFVDLDALRGALNLYPA